MNTRRCLILGGALMISLWGYGQRQSAKTFEMKGNPVITDKFTADPAPLIHDGTLYLYVGHDEARDGEMFNITEWLCYSTKDMKTWTDHGTVLKPTDFSWAVGEAWASQVAVSYTHLTLPTT